MQGVFSGVEQDPSNLYLRREGPKLTLTVEHRAAASAPAVTLELVQRDGALALQVIETAIPSTGAEFRGRTHHRGVAQRTAADANR